MMPRPPPHPCIRPVLSSSDPCRPVLDLISTVGSSSIRMVVCPGRPHYSFFYYSIRTSMREAYTPGAANHDVDYSILLKNPHHHVMNRTLHSFAVWHSIELDPKSNRRRIERSTGSDSIRTSEVLHALVFVMSLIFAQRSAVQNFTPVWSSPMPWADASFSQKL